MEEIKLIEDPAEIVLNKNRDIRDFLGYPPNSILTFGPSLILILLLILLALGWFIRYPDTIPAKVTLLTENPPIRVVSRSSSNIKQLMVKNEQQVTKGQALALLNNTAEWEDIQTFEQFLVTLKSAKSPGEYLRLDIPENLSLGPVQLGYATLLQKLDDYENFSKEKGPEAKINSLKNQIEHTKKLNLEITKQEITLSKEVGLALENYSRNQGLNKEGIISDIDLETTEAHYLQYKRQLETIRTQYISNNIRIEELQNDIVDINQNRQSGKNTKVSTLEEDINRLQSDINDWRQNYLITAPIAGKISLSKIWSEQQFVNANEEVLVIIPTQNKGEIIGKAILPLANSGKVKTGQNANLLLDGYPYQEFGVITTKVQTISPIAQNANYLVELSIPDSLLTSYGKVIPFKQEMSGTAQIITEDRRIVERLFDKLLNILKNN